MPLPAPVLLVGARKWHWDLEEKGKRGMEKEIRRWPNPLQSYLFLTLLRTEFVV